MYKIFEVIVNGKQLPTLYFNRRVLFLNEVWNETDQSENSIHKTPPTQKKHNRR